MKMQKNSKVLIKATSQVAIKADLKTVFDYVSDLSNDRNWRKEINETKIGGQINGTNFTAAESSFLSKKIPAHITQLRCESFVPNSLVIFESIQGTQFYQKNERAFHNSGDQVTTFVYTIEFDSEIVRYGLGFSLPQIFLKYYTKSTMNKYLSHLKRLLEKS